MTTNVTSILELTDAEFDRWLELSQAAPEKILDGRGVALIFERPSLRTRSACEVAIADLGGYAVTFQGSEVGLGERESAADVARTLAQNFTLTAWRVRQHDVFAQAAATTGSRLAYINLLSNRSHPTQAIADVLTLAEHAGGLDHIAGTTVTYIGDAANVSRSLAAALIRLGVHVRLSSPEGYDLDAATAEKIAAASRAGGSLTLIADPYDAVAGCSAVYCDAFISMGDEAQRDRRLADLAPWRLDASLFAAAPPDAVVMHCLPAHRGEEITDDVLDSPRSLIWRQVAYRRHAIRGALRLIEEGRS